MKSKRFTAFLVCAVLAVLTVIAAAAFFFHKNTGPRLDCPFTEMNWSSTPEDVISTEGNGYSTYDSVYGGTCYAYPKEYNGKQGTVKYMFDGREQLMCAAWAYGCNDADELLSLYEAITNSVNDIHGESGYAADNPGNYGNVWYLDTGDIVLTTMITEEIKALQYAYLHPSVSNSGQSSP